MRKRCYYDNPPRGVAALVSVSDDKIQITILILTRGALSMRGPFQNYSFPHERFSDSGRQMPLRLSSVAAGRRLVYAVDWLSRHKPLRFGVCLNTAGGRE